MEMCSESLQPEFGYDQSLSLVMKYISHILLTAMLLTFGACGEVKNESTENTTDMETKETTLINATPEQLAGIRKALDLYAEAAIKGDSKIAEPAFASTATMSFAQDGALVSVPIQALFDYYNTECPQPASYEISVCDVADDAAIVRIESQFGETKFADMFTLVRDGEDWKIISKIYHVK